MAEHDLTGEAHPIIKFTDLFNSTALQKGDTVLVADEKNRQRMETLLKLGAALKPEKGIDTGNITIEVRPPQPA